MSDDTTIAPLRQPGTILDPLTEIAREGARQIQLDQIGRAEIRREEPILKRRDRVPVVTVRSEISESTKPLEVSKEILTGR